MLHKLLQITGIRKVSIIDIYMTQMIKFHTKCWITISVWYEAGKRQEIQWKVNSPQLTCVILQWSEKAGLGKGKIRAKVWCDPNLELPLNFSTSRVSVQKKYLVTFVQSLKIFHTKGFLNVRM